MFLFRFSRSLGKERVGGNYKHFAPNGARTTHRLWKGSQNYDDEG
jgi:hypothetical protein